MALSWLKRKEGKAGRINVDYNFNYTLSQPAYLAEKLDSYTAALYVNRGLQYDGRAPQYTEKDLQLFRDGTDPQGHPNTDWHKVDHAYHSLRKHDTILQLPEVPKR